MSNGALYNWYAVNSGRLCPTGWHIPTDSEWSILTTYLGGTSVAGGKLKEAGTVHWINPNTGATNETGFSPLPCGNRRLDGSFFYHTFNGYWWSSTQIAAGRAWNRSLYFDYSGILSNDSGVTFGGGTGFSVRCVRD